MKINGALIPADGFIQIIDIGRKLGSKQEYSKFIFNELIDYIDTDYFIIFQADGFILNWRAWTNEFLNYDVVGAQWVWYNDGHRCSNGGFCLRSKMLHEVIKMKKHCFKKRLYY